MNSIKIIELPKCRVVTSGYAINEVPFKEDGLLMQFYKWWTEYDKTRADRWFPRDFIMYGREENALIWYYAVPDNEEIKCDFDIVSFEGGLYAAAVAIDSKFEDEQLVYGEIKKWIKNSNVFDLDERPGHYDMSHAVTPEYVKEAMGYGLLEIYVPIKLRIR